MRQNSLGDLALPAVVALISFLAYGPQLLFRHMEPYALERRQTVIFNVLVACIWTTYAQASFTNPGWVTPVLSQDPSTSEHLPLSRRVSRWCRKCEASKPPRAHHCKVCQRCIPKMDHHCPWTINCVSHRTLPHFLRFLFYATASMVYLEYFLFLRVAVVWAGRNLPSYLGPTPAQLVLLFIFLVTNSITLLALAILLARNIWCLGSNVTTIEGWEIERHETLVRRARTQGGYLDGPDGIRLKVRKQEFPYDIGILQNMRQGMGGTPLLWLWPFAATPSNDSGQEFETNGFEDPSTSWPPPDPDRMPRSNKRPPSEKPFVYNEDSPMIQNSVDAFRRRQQEDLKRYDGGATPSVPRRSLHERYKNRAHDDKSLNFQPVESHHFRSGEEGWQDSEGDRLDDFGVDEDVEFYDQDDIPLANLIRRRNKSAVTRTSENNSPAR
ncbi:palmitoyltransferase with autoacylation activity Pfa4 [Usnea florida]